MLKIFEERRKKNKELANKISYKSILNLLIKVKKNVNRNK